MSKFYISQNLEGILTLPHSIKDEYEFFIIYEIDEEACRYRSWTISTSGIHNSFKWNKYQSSTLMSLSEYTEITGNELYLKLHLTAEQLKAYAVVKYYNVI